MSDLYLIHSIDETTPDGDYLVHHGILGQKWGVRRFQNADGTLTEAGRARIAKYRDKADEYKTKVPVKYHTSIGEHKAKKYTQKAIAMEGKASKIERASEKAQKKYNKNLVKKLNKYSDKIDKMKIYSDLAESNIKTYGNNKIVNKTNNLALKKYRKQYDKYLEKYEKEFNNIKASDIMVSIDPYDNAWHHRDVNAIRFKVKEK